MEKWCLQHFVSGVSVSLVDLIKQTTPSHTVYHANIFLPPKKWWYEINTVIISSSRIIDNTQDERECTEIKLGSTNAVNLNSEWQNPEFPCTIYIYLMPEMLESQILWFLKMSIIFLFFNILLYSPLTLVSVATVDIIVHILTKIVDSLSYTTGSCKMIYKLPCLQC